ncbi:MAG: hypothetical protein ACKOKC_15410, partial [Chthoniobacterales bacterium]
AVGSFQKTKGTARPTPLPREAALRRESITGAAPWQDLVVKLCHLPAAVGLILSVAMLIIGVVKHRASMELNFVA